MKTKTILSIAIMAALPFGAHADPVGPAAVPANGTPVVATASAPYVTQTPTAADATHIASTAYVKGAYNDAIAAVNKVANTVDGKQAQLVNFDNNNPMYNKVFADATGIGSNLIDIVDNEYAAMRDDIALDLSDGASHNPDETLISTGAVLTIVRDAGHLLREEAQNKQDKLIGNTTFNDGDVQPQLYQTDTGLGAAIMTGYNALVGDRDLQNTIPSVAGVASFIKGAIDTQRVEIYTTWENDNAKQQVAFVTAQ